MGYTEHLYIHIPFCYKICTYCDFYRKESKSFDEQNKYISKIIKEINETKTLFKTIYIGGGTPNYLDLNLLDKLLSACKNKLKEKYEFTIECNPEFVSENQTNIFSKNKVNRISLGVQTTNENILELLNRNHKNSDVINAIKCLKEKNIKNISCDFIYNLPLMKIADIDKDIQFVQKYEIPHLSFYALEIKEGSIMNKKKYKTNFDKENDQFEHIEKKLNKTKYERYEISNWALNSQFKSKHNMAYWTLKNWKAIGISAYGFENNIYYKNEGNILNWKKQAIKWTDKELYENILIMGLRLIDGVDLSNPRNYQAYLFFKDKLDKNKIIIYENDSKTWLKAKNPNLLNDNLIEII